MKFTVNREKWQRGVRGASSLLNAEGKMCCLGFVCRAVGMAPRSILNRGMPDDIVTSGERRVRGLLTEIGHANEVRSNALAWEAAGDNDNPLCNDVEREELLSALFAKHGHTLEFVG